VEGLFDQSWYTSRKIENSVFIIQQKQKTVKCSMPKRDAKKGDKKEKKNFQKGVDKGRKV
jgi:hypothetical protein